MKNGSERKQKIKNKWTPLLVISLDSGHCEELGIYTTPAFEELIRYERVRADRDQRYFSLLYFDILKIEKPIIGRFVDNIKENMRIIDHIGWVDSNTIGVILPSTAPIGAKGFAEKIEGLISESGIRVPYELYSYPQGEDLQDGTKFHFKEEGNKGVFNKEHVEKAVLPKIPFGKRLFDILASGLGLFILSPFFILLGIYIKLVSPGSVLYRSKRVGLGGKDFSFLKFRTMHEENNQNTHASHAVDFIKSNKTMEKLDHKDPRIIPGGKLLRASCIDELPQLINVFRGDMSLVGPRPCIPYERDEYLRWHKHRFDTLPGMTGLWQVSGKNSLTFQQMVRLDITYVRNMSLLFDIKLIFKTFPVIYKMVFSKTKAKTEEKRHRDSDLTTELR